jgi:dihydrofolate reductase
MMASFWPTPQALEVLPVVAKQMNSLPKVVFSRTMDHASWNNTTLVKDGLVAEVQRLKQETGPDMVIMGSGSIVSQVAQAGLVDEFQIIFNAVALGGGKTMFEGMKDRLPLKLTRTRTFKNGNVMLCYEPAA